VTKVGNGFKKAMAAGLVSTALTGSFAIVAAASAKTSPWLKPAVEKAPRSTSPVVLILMENHSLKLITRTSAPYLTSFASAGTLFTSYSPTVESTSLPRYLDITSGSNQGCTTDGCPRQTYTADNIFNQLGSNWQSWQESMPTPCDLRNGGLYVVRHDPAAYFTDLIPTCPTQNLLYPAALPATLPSFTFITPNLCDDMHGGRIACATGTALITAGDTWLSTHVPPLLAKGAIVIITFDEGGGSLYTAERGPGVRVAVDAAPYTHYNLLAGLEDYFGVPRLANAVGRVGLPI
jgi:phosphatidylinositol-3-phosphatase